MITSFEAAGAGYRVGRASRCVESVNSGDGGNQVCSIIVEVQVVNAVVG